MNNSFDAYLNADDPVYVAHLQYRRDFGSDALIADFFVMPALILLLKPFGPAHEG